MALVKLCFSPALLFLALTCSLWQAGQSVPVMSKGPVTDSCLFDAQMLLQNITHTLTQKNLFSGIDCAKQMVELNMDTNTPSVCAPKESTCSGSVQSEFDQESCVANIGEDLHYYYTFLAAQPDPDSLLGPSVLISLKEFMQNCFTWSTDMASEEAVDRPSTYDERLSLCKVLKGFHIRTITINRALAYMNSGEHTK
ncbi:interleukin-12 subunit alpha-like [Chaetodon trifascialis]|uniref:interleukin-12 subunit alpha-like n=1 Tax=Chaetodon trifascialis TaxID=109706 RepID=UPI003995A344